MSYVYRIGYGDYDYAECKLYEHSKKFTKEELKEIYKHCLISAAFTQTFRDEDCYDIADIDISKGLKRLGFKKIKVENEVSINNIDSNNFNDFIIKIKKERIY